ncbi:protein FAM92A-A [Belonocnema kinseyi]|uniref:protein FAM92A-A n=1 Tax=Belonocnema kinseyi TaxID=2817044 RepID=UPI00143DDE28|nr:protein FAM92A-A [Belonocnema kinseyi]
MLRARSQTNICEQEVKFVQERISATEKNFSELCTVFAAFTRKAARLRDKNDEVAKAVENYAKSESINRSLSTSLTNFASTLSVIGDYRDAEVQRLDSKVISTLSQYSATCKNAREDVKNTFTAREREVSRRRHLDKVRERNPRNRQLISQAESELMKASMEMARVVKGLEEQIDSFEKQKLHDVKTIFSDFVTIQLSFHAKAVELLTKAYQDIAEIDQVRDLEEFRELMQVPDSMARIDAMKRTSIRQAYSLSSLASRFSSPRAPKKPNLRAAESLDSPKMEFAHSSESAQIEEFGESSEDETSESESESAEEMPIKVIGRLPQKNVSRMALRVIPPVSGYQKNLVASVNRQVS